MTHEEFWTVPFKEEVTNEDGHQFAGMIVSVPSSLGGNKERALRRAKTYFRSDSRPVYNGPILPRGYDTDEVIAKSEIHRSTAGEIYHSNVSLTIDHTSHGPSGDYNHYSRYHYPEPENGPSSNEKAENRMKKLDINSMV